MTKEQFKQFLESDDESIEWMLLEGTVDHLHEKMSKLMLKTSTESYDKGYKAGANQQDNKPCVCGFWGDS
jgi:hypothetical protein